MKSKIFAVILAAGESSRMGMPKALLQIHGKTFLEYLLESIKKAGLENISVIVGHDAEMVMTKFLNLNVDFIINKDYKKGQLSSIQAAIKSVPKNTDAVLICPIDRPLFSSGLINKLFSDFVRTGSPVVVPVYDAKRGHPMIFSSSVFMELMRAPIDVGARAVVWAHHSEVVEVPTNEEGILINIDTPELYEKYIQKNM
jgi:molybdenum cofactor cytidylyltransferase